MFAYMTAQEAAERWNISVQRVKDFAKKLELRVL